MPAVLKIAGAMPGMGVGTTAQTGSLESILKEVSGAKTDKAELSTSEIEEKEMGLQMLKVFAEQLEEKFAPYVEETTKILAPVLTFGANSDLRKSAAGLMPCLISCVKAAGYDATSLMNAGVRYLESLMLAHNTELHVEIKSIQILAMKDVLEIMGHFMAAENTLTFINTVLGFFKTSNDRKNALISNKDQLKEEEEDGEKEDEDEEEMEESIEAEDEYQKNLTYLLGAVVDNHKDESLPHVSTIISNIVQPYLTGTVRMQKVALFILDDLVEYLGVAKLGVDMWKQLAALILTYATRNEHELRQAACYGVGCLAKTGETAFAGISIQCLTALAAAIEVPKDKKKKDEWAGARDNAISSIGKILKYQPNAIPFAEVWSKWLGYLPLKEDKQEAKFAHQFVVETLIANPELAVGANGIFLSEIVRIFVQVYETKRINKSTKSKIVLAMKQLSAHSAVVAILEDIYKNKLKDNDKSVLEQILKASQ